MRHNVWIARRFFERIGSIVFVLSVWARVDAKESPNATFYKTAIMSSLMPSNLHKILWALNLCVEMEIPLRPSLIPLIKTEHSLTNLSFIQFSRLRKYVKWAMSVCVCCNMRWMGSLCGTDLVFCSGNAKSTENIQPIKDRMLLFTHLIAGSDPGICYY